MPIRYEVPLWAFSTNVTQSGPIHWTEDYLVWLEIANHKDCHLKYNVVQYDRSICPFGGCYHYKACHVPLKHEVGLPILITHLNRTP